MTTEQEDRFLAELAVLEAEAERAVAPWKGRLPAAELALLHETIVEVLATHPNGRALVASLLPRGPVEVSGEIGDPREDEARGDGKAQGGSGGA